MLDPWWDLGIIEPGLLDGFNVAAHQVFILVKDILYKVFKDDGVFFEEQKLQEVDQALVQVGFEGLQYLFGKVVWSDGHDDLTPRKDFKNDHANWPIVPENMAPWDLSEGGELLATIRGWALSAALCRLIKVASGQNVLEDELCGIQLHVNIIWHNVSYGNVHVLELFQAKHQVTNDRLPVTFHLWSASDNAT